MVPPYFCIGKRFFGKIPFQSLHIIIYPNYITNGPRLQEYATFSTGFEACFFFEILCKQSKKIESKSKCDSGSDEII